MVEITDLKVHYGSFKALDGAGFTARPGQVLGLLGPNGAGKSTLMKCLTSQIVPREGSIVVHGVDVLSRPLEAKRLIGYLPENPPLYPEMEVVEYLRFTARARGLDVAQAKIRMDWVTKACGLARMLRMPLSSLSKGYRQRVGLAQCLIHDPRVIILDEPTSGLDPLQIIDIRRLIRDLARERTVIFSTHILQEAEALSDHIVVLMDGRVVADRPLPELLGEGRPAALEVTVEADSDVFERLVKDLPGVGSCHQIGMDGDGLVSFQFLDSVPGFWRTLSCALAAEGIPIRRMHEPERRLEDIFSGLAWKQSGDGRP